MEMSRAMDETRKSLLAMSTRNDFTGSDSPEKEDPPSPPTKLEEINQRLDPGMSSTHYATSPPSAVDGRLKSGPKDIPTKPTRTSAGNALTSPVRMTPSGPAARRISQERERRRSASKSEQTEDATKDKSGTGQAYGTAGTVPQRRTRPSYFKPTQSSKNRNSHGGESSVLPLSKPTSAIGGGSTASAAGGSGRSSVGGSSKLSNRMKMSSSKLALYASTPNLMSSSIDDEDDEDTNGDSSKGRLAEKEKIQSSKSKTTRMRYTSTTNLRLLSDLSRSVPDVNDDGSSSTGSSSTGADPRPPGKDKPRDVFKSGGQLHPKRPDYHPQETAPVNGQTRRKSSASEMTLDQAKSILLGKSGLLAGSGKVSAGSRQQTGSDSGAGTSLRSNSSLDSSPTITASSSGSPHQLDLSLARDIEQTAESIRRSSAAYSSPQRPLGQHPPLDNLEASPLDLPERDQPAPSQRRLAPKTLSISLDSGATPHPTQSQTFNHLPARSSSANSTFVIQDIESQPQEDEDIARSVRDRIAQFQTPKHPINSDVDRSRRVFSLAQATHPAHTSVTVAQCETAISDFMEKLDNLKDIFSQVDGRNDETSCEVLALLGSACNQAQKVISDLAAKSPCPTQSYTDLQNKDNGTQATPSHAQRLPISLSSTSNSSSFSSSQRTVEKAFQSKAATDPYSQEGKASSVSDSHGSKDPSISSLLASTKDMLQPLLAHFSDNLAEEVVRFIQDKEGSLLSQ